MNKEISVYELLGLVKDGKAPKIIKWKGYIFSFYNNDYLCKNEDFIKNRETNYLLCYLFSLPESPLNIKVEILEKDKPIIEKLDVALLSQSDNWLWCPSKDEFSKDIELNSYIIQNIRENTLYFQRKINEIIEFLNRKEDK